MSPYWWTFAAALVTAITAATGGYLVRGSTAVPAAIWATLAAGGLAMEAAATASGWLVDPASRGAVRLVVVALGVCPMMSILGAKRPQHGVWQFIVGTLACVISMPAATAVLVRPGSMPDLHPIEQAFLPLPVMAGLLNFVATGRFLAAALVFVGQLALMWPFLPIVGKGECLSGELEAAAAGIVMAGALLAVVRSTFWPVSRRASKGLAGAIDPPFLAVRETLGAAWTLRIAERFNAVATERGWPCRLRISGLAIDADAADGPWQIEAMRCVRSLLRRFVSAAWMVRHGNCQPGMESREPR